MGTADLAMDVLAMDVIGQAEAKKQSPRHYGLEAGKGTVSRADRLLALSLSCQAIHAMLELRSTDEGRAEVSLLKGDEIEALIKTLYEARAAAKSTAFDAAIRSTATALALSVATGDTKVDPLYVADALRRMGISKKDPVAQLAIAHVVLNACIYVPDVARETILKRRSYQRLCNAFASALKR